jgi:hypothetical protein
MLRESRRKLAAAPRRVRDVVTLVRGDMRSWAAPEPFDLIVVPCSTFCHLLPLEDQLVAWRRAHDNLVPGGRLVVDVVMPRLGSFADWSSPPRALVEIDNDSTDAKGRRLVRYKTTLYAPHEQRASIRFLYDKFDRERHADRYVSDFESHVYFPRELELLFLTTGFTVEDRWGDYRFRPPRASSQVQIVVGRRPRR